jgi:hypothetical protein
MAGCRVSDCTIMRKLQWANYEGCPHLPTADPKDKVWCKFANITTADKSTEVLWNYKKHLMEYTPEDEQIHCKRYTHIQLYIFQSVLIFCLLYSSIRIIHKRFEPTHAQYYITYIMVISFNTANRAHLEWVYWILIITVNYNHMSFKTFWCIIYYYYRMMFWSYYIIYIVQVHFHHKNLTVHAPGQNYENSVCVVDI